MKILDHLVSQKEGLFNKLVFVMEVDFMKAILKNINTTEII